MNSVLVSPWFAANLERLGWTLLHFLWQGTLVAVLLAVGLAALRRASARWRYLAGVVATATALLMPVVTFVTIRPAVTERAAVQNEPPRVNGPITPQAGRPGETVFAGPIEPAATGGSNMRVMPPQPARAQLPPQTWIGSAWKRSAPGFAARLHKLLPWCGVGWMLGVLALSVRLLVGWTQAQRLCRRGTRTLDARWQASLERLVRRMGVRQAVRLLESTVAQVPTVIGALRPVILLPVGMLTGLSVAQVEMILAHELAHIRRQDYLINLGLTLFETLGFYHPAVWWIAARVREEREHACDDLAVQATGNDRVGYAQALATLEEMRGPVSGVALAATSGGRGTLLARVRRLLGVVPERKTRGRRNVGWLAGTLALLIAGALTLGSFQHPAHAQGEAKPAGSPATVAPKTAAPSDPGELTGRVVDEAGNPVEGALVYDDATHDGNVEFPPNPLVTDATGAFRVPKLHFPGQWRFIGARLGGESVGWLDIGAGRQPTALSADDILARSIVLRKRRFALRGTCVDEQGKPVAGATIAITSLPSEGSGSFGWQSNHPEDPMYRFWETLTTRSGADGSFTLSTPLPKGMQVEISAPGKETVYPFHIVKAGVPPVTDLGQVTLAGAGRIAGRIVFVPRTGEPQPLKGALLLAVNAAELKAVTPIIGPREYENVPYSDEQGRYQMEHLPPGTYTVYLFGTYQADPGKEPTTMAAAENVVVRAGETTPLDLRAIPGRRVRVRVVDPDTNQPVRDQPVHFFGPSRPASSGQSSRATSLDKGDYMLQVSPGHYRVFVPDEHSSNGQELAGAEVDVPADRDPEPVLLKIKTGPHLLGKVQDAQGKFIPLTGAANIVLLETGPILGGKQGGNQSSNGSFDIPLTKTGMRARLAVDVMGYRPFLSPEFAVSDAPEPMTVTLEPAPDFVIRGRVLDQDGHPVARGNVYGTLFPADGLSYYVRLGSGIPEDELYTDEDGRFETHRIRAGAKFRLDVDAGGKAVAASAGWTQLGESSDVGKFDIEMHALPITRAAVPEVPIGPRDLAGHVVDAQGKPVEGAVVTVAGAYSPDPGGATTNAAGGFRFPEFGDQSYLYLAVTKEGYATHWVTDLTVGKDFNVPLENRTRLRGQFILPDASSAGRAHIVLRTARPTKRAFMMNPIWDLRVDRETDEQGRYNFPVEAGEYSAEITSADGSLAVRYDHIEVAEGQSGTLPATLSAGLTLRVQTVDRETRQPVAGLKFSISETTDAAALGIKSGSERVTDAQGFATWEHLLPGRTEIRKDQTGVYQRLWSLDSRDESPLSPPANRLPTGYEGTYFELVLNPTPERAGEPIIVQVERGVRVYGEVQDAQGKPARDVNISALADRPASPGENRPGPEGLGPFAVYEQDGVFSGYIAAGNGVPSRLTAHPRDDGQGVTHSEPFDSRPGDERHFTLRMNKGGVIEGTIADKQGKLLPNVSVSGTPLDHLDSQESCPWATSDARGHFHMEHVRPTEYEITTTIVPHMSVGNEPPQEKRRVVVPAGGHVEMAALHFDPAGWTPPAPAPVPAAEPTPMASPAPAVEMLTARVKIVDEQGQPIAGATVTPDGLRPRGNASGGHYFWPAKRLGPPVPALTDAAGIATVRYPRFIDEKQRTGAISFRAEHPDYCAVRPTNYRIEDPDKVEPVTLRRGATLRVSGHLPGSTTAVPIFPQQDDPTHSSLLPTGWKDLGGNVLETRQLPAGRNYVRLAHAAADGHLFFSETKLVNAAPGQTDALDLELRPGVRVEGRLDDFVPRPVRDGKVVIRAFATSPESDANWIDWESWRDVAADGTFIFESLPPGRLEIAALCDGYTSVNLPDTEFGGTLNIPQHFDLLPGKPVPAEVKMQPAAVCTVQVRDTAGAPVSGARVAFNPNVRWTPGLTTIFCRPNGRMEDFVKSRKKEWPTQDWVPSGLFQAVSDARGNATVRNLPAMNGSTFGVTAEYYETFPSVGAVRRAGDQDAPNLAPGAAVTVTVHLTRPGVQPLAEEPADDTPTPASTPASPPRRRSPEQSSANAHLSVRPVSTDPGTFSGRVIDETGKGLPGVLVDAWTWYPGHETTTDADGNFRLVELELRRQIEVRFSKEGYVPRLVVKQSLGELDQPLTLTTHTYFEGVVTDPDGHPAAGAWVRANQGPKDADGVFIDTIWTETHADAQGRYRLYAQGDRYEFQVTTPTGSVERLPEVELVDGETRRLDIALRPGVVFRAKVVDGPDGAPVAGAKFSDREHPGMEGTSGPDGTLEIRGLPPGKFEFQVEAKGFTRWWSEQCASKWNRFNPEFERGTRWQRNFDNLDFDLQPGGPPVTITLERGVRIRGRALDPDGKPVGGATVTAARTGSGNSLTGDTRFSLPTSADGAFDLLLPASKEGEYNLEVHDGKYGEWRRWANGVLPPIHTQPGQEISGVEIRLRRPAVVRGQALDPAGKPVVGQTVQASAADKLENRYYDPEATTDREGRFELKWVRPGSQIIRLKVSRGGSQDLPRVTEQTVDLTEGSTLDVLLRAKGESAAGEMAAVSTPIPMASRPVPAAFPDRRAEVRGVIHDAADKPVANAEIVPFGIAHKDKSAWYGPMDEKIDERATTDNKGKFVLRHAVSEGTFMVQVNAPGFARESFDGLKVGPEGQTLYLLKHETVLGGQLLTTAGAPAAGVKLMLVQSDRSVEKFLGTYEAATDARGRFRFEGVSPGLSYDLFGLMTPSAPGDLLPTRVVVAGKEGGPQDLGNCQEQPAHRIGGRVRLADGAALPAGSTLTLKRDHAWDDQNLKLPPDGRFEFRGVPAETVLFEARVPGYANLMERTQVSLRDQYDVLQRDPSSILRDVATYERSGRNWQLPVAADRADVDLLLHANAAIDQWIAAQPADWIRRVEADYPQGTAGLSRLQLRQIARQAQTMVGPPDNSNASVPLTWHFVVGSEKESALVEIARRAKELGFEALAPRRLRQIQELAGLPPVLFTPDKPDHPMFGLELRFVELPSAEKFFEHELAVRRLMQGDPSVSWQMAGQVVRKDP